jgi:hypothetical protein
MTKLEEQPLMRNEDSFRTVSTMQSLLHCFQGDMQPQFREDMVTFFSALFPKLNALRQAASAVLVAICDCSSFLQKFNHVMHLLS